MPWYRLLGIRRGLKKLASVLCALCLVSPSIVGHVLAGEAALTVDMGVERGGIRTRYLLVGPSGQAVTEQDFPGKFQLITFGYTFCPDICPTTLAEMTDVLKQLGEDAASVQAVFITLDPERDTPRQLKTYVQFFDSRIMGLSGTPALIQRAAQNYKIRYSKVPAMSGEPGQYSVDHSAGMFLLSPKGNLLHKYAYGHPVADIVRDIQQYLGR